MTTHSSNHISFSICGYYTHSEMKSGGDTYLIGFHDGEDSKAVSRGATILYRNVNHTMEDNRNQNTQTQKMI